jgi:hypothetical protein
MEIKLTELQPNWIVPNNMSHTDIKCGISFICPCCNTKRLAVLFKPAISSRELNSQVDEWIPGEKCWQRTSGETFGDISLEPSVNFSDNGHFHGNIVNGIIQY